jgi:hypothetical protein
MKVAKKDLKVGHFYYVDRSRKNVGLLVEKDEESDTLFFNCGANTTYVKSALPGKEHLTPFAYGFGGDLESVVD